MMFMMLTVLVFIEMIVMAALYVKLGSREHAWLIQIFFVFFFAGLVALPIEKLLFHVDSIMWELLVVGIGAIVIGSLASRLIEQHREALAS